MIHTSAPGKLILFGEHVGRHGKPVVVFAINQRIHVYLTPRNDSSIYLTSKEMNVVKEKYPSEKLDFISGTIKEFFDKTGKIGGFDLETKSSMLPGFGSSGAVLVATLGALDAHFDTKISKDEMLAMGLKIEREVSGIGSGLDIAPALFGGLIWYQKGKGVRQIKYKEFPIVVGNTGIKIKSKPIVDAVTILENKYPETFKSIIDKIGEIGDKATEALEAGDTAMVGELMNINHGLLYAEGVSSAILERLVWAARDAGAAGAKLSGAGKGDNMLALAPGKKEEVRKAIEEGGGIVNDICIDPEGLIVNSD